VNAQETAEKTFEFYGNRYLLTPDGLGARRWNKTGKKWEKKVALFAQWNDAFRAAGQEAK
jgi:hypothetical protein